MAQIGNKRSYLLQQAEGYAQYLRSVEKSLDASRNDEGIKEVVFTSQSHYSLLYPVKVKMLRVKEPEHLFFMATFVKSETNLAMALSKVREVVSDFAI